MELLCNMSPMLHVPRPQVCPLRLSLLPSLIPSLILNSHLALAHLRPLHCRPIHRVITDTLSSLFAFIYMSLSCFLCTILILSPGCDFNGPIWNITGVPTAGDDVIITSDVQTTIFANSTSISLNSLWIGGNGTSAAITIVLTNCVLNITESTSMSYTSSCLHINLTSLPQSHIHLTLSLWDFLLVFLSSPPFPFPRHLPPPLLIAICLDKIGLYWGDSILELYSSTLNSQDVHGATLFATNGVSFVFVVSLCRGRGKGE